MARSRNAGLRGAGGMPGTIIGRCQKPRPLRFGLRRRCDDPADGAFRRGRCWSPPVLAAALVLIATRADPLLSPDSITYLSVADHVRSGHGLTDFTGKPLAVFGPVYPAAARARRSQPDVGDHRRCSVDRGRQRADGVAAAAQGSPRRGAWRRHWHSPRAKASCGWRRWCGARRRTRPSRSARWSCCRARPITDRTAAIGGLLAGSRLPDSIRRRRPDRDGGGDGRCIGVAGRPTRRAGASVSLPSLRLRSASARCGSSATSSRPASRWARDSRAAQSSHCREPSDWR